MDVFSLMYHRQQLVSDLTCGDVRYNITLLAGTELIWTVSTIHTIHIFSGLNEQISYSVLIVVTDIFGNSGSMSLQTGMMTSIVSQSMYYLHQYHTSFNNLQ